MDLTRPLRFCTKSPSCLGWEPSDLFSGCGFSSAASFTTVDSFWLSFSVLFSPFLLRTLATFRSPFCVQPFPSLGLAVGQSLLRWPVDEQSKHLEDFSNVPQACAKPHFSPLRHPSSVPQKRHGAFSPSGLSHGFCPSPVKALTAGFPCVSTGANAGGFDGVAFPAVCALANSSSSAWMYSAHSLTEPRLGALSTSSCWRMVAKRNAT